MALPFAMSLMPFGLGQCVSQATWAAYPTVQKCLTPPPPQHPSPPGPPKVLQHGRVSIFEQAAPLGLMLDGCAPRGIPMTVVHTPGARWAGTISMLWQGLFLEASNPESVV